MDNVLHLNLKGIYFDEIKTGAKSHEFRIVNNYWSKRLVGRNYSHILIKRGYPKRGDSSKEILLPYLGYEIKTITHQQFGPEPVDVFAIKVN